MISTSFITGTGFIKCMPITWLGLFVTEAKSVMEIEEVLLAKMQCDGAYWSNCSKILFLISLFSVAASTTISAFVTPSWIEVFVVILEMVEALVASSIIFFASCLSKFFWIVCIAFANAASCV